ncbi:MAG: hypothetical protein LBI02_11320 [Opitutaceae bacterium]|jgi:hypothetical protein|nr:hypothetical protein [Opitutaceae bacterium]
MGLFSGFANATGLSSLAGLLTPAGIPCVCPLKLVEQLKQLIPRVPIPIPEVPIPKLEPLAPVIVAAPANPANNFIRARLDVFAKMRIPEPVMRLPLDHVKIGQMESLPPFVRVMEGMMKMKIDDPKLAAKINGSLAGLVKIPLPSLSAAPPPPPPKPIQRMSAIVTQMRMMKAALDIKLLPVDPKALVKIQMAVKTVAAIPPFPAGQMAPLAPLATLVRLTETLGIDIREPKALGHLANKLNAIVKLPPPPPIPPPVLPAVLNILGIAQTYDNVARFFKIDLARLNPGDFVAKIHTPLQRVAEITESLTETLTPRQAANAQSWTQASQFFPALRLMKNFDIGRIDFAPLQDLPPLPNVGPMTSLMTVGEAVGAAKKGAKKCPSCPLAA